jgi:hypothetical protein
MKLLQEEITKILDQAFSKLRKRAIYREAKSLVNAFLDEHRDRILCRFNYTHKLEAHALYTLSDETFERNRETERRILLRHRHHYRWVAHTGQTGDRIRPWELLTEEERIQDQARMQKEALKLGKDPYEKELEVAAWVRGYYLTAANRFVDNICMHIASGLFPDLSESVGTFLDTKLGLVNSAGESCPSILTPPAN